MTLGSNPTSLSAVSPVPLLTYFIITATYFIFLSAAELTVGNDAISFTNRDSFKVFKSSKVELFENDEILVLEFPEEIPIGLGVLSIQFDGMKVFAEGNCFFLN
ncbi:hypothetical protein RYX36_013561 [Vicia faba]